MLQDKFHDEEELSEELPEEEIDEVPLENDFGENEEILLEEGSLDGDEEEVNALAEEMAEETDGEEIADTVSEPREVEENAEETADKEIGEEEKPHKEEFKLTPPENLEEILSNICAKRARKLIYRPSEEIFALTATVLGTDKNNEEKIKIKNILEAEIKEGVKLGYLDKFDGLKGSELKEEYENDIVYEFAEQEFKRTGLVWDGKKAKVYIYDWDMKACHHVGYLDDEAAESLKPYLSDKEKYSFDVSGIITGGKYKKVIKDPVTGKVTVEKGNDGKLGIELDVTIINRKD